MIGSRRKQENPDRGKYDGEGTIRPFGHDPEELNDADRDERAPRIDERRQPIGCAQPKATAARNGTNRSGDKQREPVERIRNSGQQLSSLVGEQPQRWRAGGHRDQRPQHHFTGPALADGFGHPARRHAVLRRSQFLRNALQDGIGLLPSLVVRQPRQQHRDRAPADLGGEQTIHSRLQHRRMLTELRGFSFRHVDDRVERDDPPDQLLPSRLRLWHFRPRQGALMARWQTAMFTAMAFNFVPLLAPANQMSYDTVQFYNGALAIVAGSGAAAVSFRLMPPLSPAFRTRRLLRLTLRDLRRLATGPIPRAPGDWEGRIYGRLAALPDAAEPLQRSQFLAALSVGNGIIQLRHIASRLGLGSDLDAALEAFAQGNSAIATTRLARLDDRLAARPDAGSEASLLSRRAGVSLQSRRPSSSMPLTSTQERPCEVHRHRCVRHLRCADVVDVGRGLARHDRASRADWSKMLFSVLTENYSFLR